MKKITVSILCLFICLFSSCTKNSEEMKLKGVLDYDWNTSIEDVEKDFNKKGYSEIKISKAEIREAEIEAKIEAKIEIAPKYLSKDFDYIDYTINSEYLHLDDLVSDRISAKMNYNGSPALIEIDYFNKQMFSGEITIDELKEDEVPEIKEKHIIEFKKKYGEPQEVEKSSSTWNFKNNFSLYVSSYCSGILAKCSVYTVFTNKTLYEGKEASNKQKIEEVKEKIKEKEQKRRVDAEAKKLQWLEENKEKVKEKVKGKLMISSDDFKDIKWINSTHKKAGNLLEKLYLYIPITKSGDASLRMVINHITSTDRMFNMSNKYEFKIDDERETLEPKSNEKIDFESGRSVDYYEMFDVNADRDESRITLLKNIANSKKTIVRFEGKLYYKDREISEKEKEGIETILLTYEYLKNGGSLEDIL